MTSFHSPLCSVHILTQNPPGALGVSRGDPSNDPPSDDPDSDFDSPDTSDIEDADPVVIFANLAKAIKGLARSLCYNPFETLQHTKVQELDQFDETDLHKLWDFLVQCKLNFQNYPQEFIQDHAKVTFMQSYLKGIALEWFKPDLLLMDNPELYPFWMENYKEFVLVKTSFTPEVTLRKSEVEGGRVLASSYVVSPCLHTQWSHISELVGCGGKDLSQGMNKPVGVGLSRLSE